MRSKVVEKALLDTAADAGVKGAEVMLIEIVGGGHAIPGGGGLGSPAWTHRWFGATNRDIDGPDEIWAFLRRHRR